MARRTPSLLLAALPGCLAGTLATGLIFFLNPGLRFGPGPVLRGILVYGLLLALAGVLLQLPLLWRKPERIRLLLPWGLTLVLAASGLLAWIHASQFAFYLPSGINRRLLKAAIWLSIAAIICFYNALWHLLRNRAVARNGYILCFCMALGSVYAVFERREAFRPPAGPAPRASLIASSQRPQLCVIGLDTATLDALLPLAEQGRLPFLNRMLQEGARARLSSLKPSRNIPLWTTVATGKLPYQHGAVGEELFPMPFLHDGAELSLLPIGIGFRHWGIWSSPRPADASARRVATIWEILSRLGVRSAAVGWPLTSPASEAVSITLSDRFFEAGGTDESGASPAEILDRARLFRTRLGELDPAVTARFGAPPPDEVLESLASDLWHLDLSDFLLAQDPRPGAYFLRLPGLEALSRAYYGGFYQVHFEAAQNTAATEGSRLLSAYYTLLDERLAKLWDQLREPRLMAVVSAVGVEEAKGWRKARGLLTLGANPTGFIDTAPAGTLLMLGNGIEAGQVIQSASLVDVAPSLLYALGFPIAQDFDGVARVQAFSAGFLARHPLTFVPSYEALADDSLTVATPLVP